MADNLQCETSLSDNQSLSLNKNLFSLIDGLASSKQEKWELLCFAYEFVVNGKLIDISKSIDQAIDKLYPVCKNMRGGQLKGEEIACQYVI